jgi:hypothetical protein
VEVEPVDDERHLVMAFVLLVVVQLLLLLLLMMMLKLVVVVVAGLLPPAEVKSGVIVPLVVVGIRESGESDSDFGLPFVDLVNRVWRLVAPATDGLDVLLCQVVEDVADVQVLLHRRPEELQAGVASKLLDFEAVKYKKF